MMAFVTHDYLENPMRFFYFALSLLLLLSSLDSTAIAGTRIRPIHPERANMGPAERRGLVLGDLKSIFTGPTSPTSITTASYASNRDGLCRRDVFVLSYEAWPVGQAEDGRRPIGIREFYSEFHRAGYANEASHDHWKTACKQLPSEGIYWARSDYDATADQALFVLEQAESRVRKNEGFDIECKDIDDKKIENACISAFLEDLPKLLSANRCLDQIQECYVYKTPQYEIKIIGNYQQYSITVESATIVVT